jgi:hypothetical protein
LPRNNENNRIKCESESEKVIWVINNHIPNSNLKDRAAAYVHDEEMVRLACEPASPTKAL